MKPIIKYRGGKYKDFESYKNLIPHSYGRYIEPFVGGGATFFMLAPQKAILCDINEPLMNFYSEVRNNYALVSRELTQLQEEYEKNQIDYLKLKASHPNDRIPNANEKLYYLLRDQFNGISERQYSRAALYYFINKTAYSGMIRYNAKGHYNVPFGRYPHLNTSLLTREHADLLQRAQLVNADFMEAFNLADENDFMYLDPPYDCIFNDYGNWEYSGGFDEGEHRRLAKAFANLRCKAMMVISRTPLTEELYGPMIKAEYGKEYSVNIRNRFHSRAMHIVVTNYEV